MEPEITAKRIKAIKSRTPEEKALTSQRRQESMRRNGTDVRRKQIMSEKMTAIRSKQFWKTPRTPESIAKGIATKKARKESGVIYKKTGRKPGIDTQERSQLHAYSV